MNHRPAFTILELLIAITLSSMIMFGLVQLYQGVIRYLDGTRDIMSANRKVCLLFNQLERDLSSAYIPFLAKEEKITKEGQPAPEEKTPDQKKKEEEQDKEQRKSFFLGIMDERVDPITIDGKKIESCKMISFICTTPLSVYAEKKPRLVRVMYEVVVDKTKSTRDDKSYQLVRKETDDLLNARGKVDEFARPEPGKAVRSYVVADDVKGFFVKYVTLQKDDKNKDKAAEQREIESFTWGDKEERQAIVPQKALIWIDFWDDKKIKSSRFHALFPILSYPTPKKEEAKDNEKDKKQPDGQPVSPAQQPAQGAAIPPAPEGTTPVVPAVSVQPLVQGGV